MTTRNVWGLLIIRNRVSSRCLNSADHRQVERRAHAQSRQHRWLEAQLVRGSRPRDTDTVRSEDVARSENKCGYIK